MGGVGPLIKDVRFDGKNFTVTCKDQLVKLAVLNCSWLPTGVFDWILARTRVAVSGRKFSGEDRLGSLWPGVRHIYRGLRADLRILLGKSKRY